MTSGVESIGTDKKLTTILIKLKNSEQSYTRKNIAYLFPYLLLIWFEENFWMVVKLKYAISMFIACSNMKK